MTPKKPNFLIIGAAKCGTSSLATILGDHPDCCMSDPKEVCYFQDQMDFAPNPNFEEGWDWYQNAFSHYDAEPMVGEATPSYTDRTRSPSTAERIFGFDPQMKLIYLVRDPLARQYSAWQMQNHEGLAGIHPDRIETQWAIEGFDYWMRQQQTVGQWDIARYDFQLDAYRAWFPETHILVSLLEDWKHNQVSELERICRFLTLDPERLEIRRPEGENRAIDKTIEPGWFRRLRSQPLVRSAGRILPTHFKRKLGMAVSRKPEVQGKSELSDTVREQFLSCVGDDARRLLRSQNRGTEVWPSIHADKPAAVTQQLKNQ